LYASQSSTVTDETATPRTMMDHSTKRSSRNGDVLRAKLYERVAAHVRKSENGGLAGAMGQLFTRYPQLMHIIEREISLGAYPDEPFPQAGKASISICMPRRGSPVSAVSLVDAGATIVTVTSVVV
jgi:hypothetical protein